MIEALITSLMNSTSPNATFAPLSRFTVRYCQNMASTQSYNDHEQHALGCVIGYLEQHIELLTQCQTEGLFPFCHSTLNFITCNPAVEKIPLGNLTLRLLNFLVQNPAPVDVDVTSYALPIYQFVASMLNFRFSITKTPVGHIEAYPKVTNIEIKPLNQTIIYREQLTFDDDLITEYDETISILRNVFTNSAPLFGQFFKLMTLAHTDIMVFFLSRTIRSCPPQLVKELLPDILKDEFLIADALSPETDILKRAVAVQQILLIKHSLEQPTLKEMMIGMIVQFISTNSPVIISNLMRLFQQMPPTLFVNLPLIDAIITADKTMRSLLIEKDSTQMSIARGEILQFLDVFMKANASDTILFCDESRLLYLLALLFDHSAQILASRWFSTKLSSGKSTFAMVRSFKDMFVAMSSKVDDPAVQQVIFLIIELLKGSFTSKNQDDIAKSILITDFLPVIAQLPRLFLEADQEITQILTAVTALFSTISPCKPVATAINDSNILDAFSGLKGSLTITNDHFKMISSFAVKDDLIQNCSAITLLYRWTVDTEFFPKTLKLLSDLTEFYYLNRYMCFKSGLLSELIASYRPECSALFTNIASMFYTKADVIKTCQTLATIKNPDLVKQVAFLFQLNTSIPVHSFFFVNENSKMTISNINTDGQGFKLILIVREEIQRGATVFLQIKDSVNTVSITMKATEMALTYKSTVKFSQILKLHEWQTFVIACSPIDGVTATIDDVVTAKIDTPFVGTRCTAEIKSSRCCLGNVKVQTLQGLPCAEFTASLMNGETCFNCVGKEVTAQFNGLWCHSMPSLIDSFVGAGGARLLLPVFENADNTTLSTISNIFVNLSTRRPESFNLTFFRCLSAILLKLDPSISFDSLWNTYDLLSGTCHTQFGNNIINDVSIMHRIKHFEQQLQTRSIWLDFPKMIVRLAEFDDWTAADMREYFKSIFKAEQAPFLESFIMTCNNIEVIKAGLGLLSRLNLPLVNIGSFMKFKCITFQLQLLPMLQTRPSCMLNAVEYYEGSTDPEKLIAAMEGEPCNLPLLAQIHAVTPDFRPQILKVVEGYLPLLSLPLSMLYVFFIAHDQPESFFSKAPPSFADALQSKPPVDRPDDILAYLKQVADMNTANRVLNATINQEIETITQPLNNDTSICEEVVKDSIRGQRQNAKLWGDMKMEMDQSVVLHHKIDFATDGFGRHLFLKRNSKYVDHKDAAERRDQVEVTNEQRQSVVEFELPDEKPKHSEGETEFEVQMMKTKSRTVGTLYMSKRSALFEAKETHPIIKDEGGHVSHRIIEFLLNDVRFVLWRRFQHIDKAAEFIMHDGRAFFFIFADRATRAMMFDELRKHHYKRIQLIQSKPAGEHFASLNFTSDWKKGLMSNYEYLWLINIFAGRTMNDISQYPVYPWVIKDYTSQALDLNREDTFRDLRKPMGAQTEERLAEYKQLKSEVDGTEFGCLYRTHYSTAAYTMSYLIRCEPFTTLNIAFQNGKFDDINRVFKSVHDAWDSATLNQTDVRELIPEFFYFSDFLDNHEHYEIGSDTVTLPPWAKTSSDFVFLNRLALESPTSSRYLPQWIDLVFGSKNRGERAATADNDFHKASYWESLEAPGADVENLQLWAANFGITPDQIFASDHVMREPSHFISLATSRFALRVQKLEKRLPETLKLGVTATKIVSMEASGAIRRYIVLDNDIKEKSVTVLPRLAPEFWVAYEQFQRHLHYISSSRSVVVSAPWRNDFEVFSLATKKKTFGGKCSSCVTALAADRADIVVTGGEDSVVTIWRHDESFAVTGHNLAIADVAVSTKMNALVSGDIDGNIVITQLSTGRKIARTQLPGVLRRLYMSTLGFIIAITDRKGSTAITMLDMAGRTFREVVEPQKVAYSCLGIAEGEVEFLFLGFESKQNVIFRVVDMAEAGRFDTLSVVKTATLLKSELAFVITLMSTNVIIVRLVPQ